MSSRLVKHLVLCLFFILLLTGLSNAQEDVSKYPSRPINFILSVPPGASPDIASRLLVKPAEKALGQPIIIMNKPGGAFSVGTAAIAAAKPDGYTIGCAAYPAMFVVPQIQKVPYHTLKDFRWIMQFGHMNFGVTTRSDSPFKSLKDVVAFARQNPNKLIIGGGGIGGFGHILMEQILRKEGLKATYMPFKGGPDTEKALLGGHIHIMTGDINFSLLEAGETRLLVLLAESSTPDYPQIPSLKDLGYDIPAPTIFPIAGPKGMPDGIARKLEAVFTDAMKDPDFIKGMKNLRCTIAYRNSKELEEYVSSNYEAFAKLLKEMDLTK